MNYRLLTGVSTTVNRRCQPSTSKIKSLSDMVSRGAKDIIKKTNIKKQG